MRFGATRLGAWVLSLAVTAALLASCNAASPPGAEPGDARPSPASQIAGATPASVERAPGSPAGDRIKVEAATTTRYYPVYGNNTTEIFAYIENYGPTDDKGQKATGVTHYKSALDWRSNGNSRSCGIASMTIRVQLEVLLPALDNPARLPADLQAKWTAFTAVVAVHEQRHVDIYLAGVNAIRDRMVAVAATSGCPTLESSVESIWSAGQADADGAQERFHEEERQRVENQRGPLKRQIDSLKSRGDGLTAQIRGFDANLAGMNGQLTATSAQMSQLQAQIKSIEDRYQGQGAPPDVVQQYDSLRNQYNSLVATYNGMVNQFNALQTQRNGITAQLNALNAELSGFIDQYNWIN